MDPDFNNPASPQVPQPTSNTPATDQATTTPTVIPTGTSNDFSAPNTQQPPVAPTVVNSLTPQSTPFAANVASATDEYISNPFLNSVRGLVMILKTNPASSLLVGFLGLILIVVGFIVLLISSLAVKSPAFVIAFSIVIYILYLLPIGAYYVIGGGSARGEVVTTGQAYSRAAKKLLPLIVLLIITSVLTVISFILLIVPGLFFVGRSSLAILVMFEEDLGPIKALKRSFSLTKGHVNEMLGALFASVFLGGFYSLLFGACSVAPLVGRYHDLRQLQESGGTKPKTHWLNYLYLLGLVCVVGLIALIVIGGHKASNSLNSSSSSINSINFNTN